MTHGRAPSIWVVMPTYNGARHLPEQLESIAAQGRLPNGLVASDDGSSDGTAEILEDFAQSAPFPVTVLRQERNLGLLSNLEAALAAALPMADVIAFCDQDDAWHPDKLAAVEEAFAQDDVLLWFSDAEFIDGRGLDYGSRLWQAVGVTAETDPNEPQHLSRFIAGLTIIGTAMAAHASLIRAAVPFPRTHGFDGTPHFLHDGWLGLIAHLRGGLSLEPRALTRYRQHDEQYTGMSVLRAAEHRRVRQRSLDARVVLEEHCRLVAAEQHLRRPHTLSFLGGALPMDFTDRGAFLSARADVVSGRRSPVALLRHRARYTRYADGWRTTLVDLARWGGAILRRCRGQLLVNPYESRWK